MYMSFFRRTVDFLAVGDIVTDAFIELKEAHVTCDESGNHCTLEMPFGTKIPYESVSVIPGVGNSPNAAVASARLGLHTALLTNIGDDAEGEDTLSMLRQEKIDTRYVTVHKGMRTNYHYVLWYKNDRTILIKHELYPYILPSLPRARYVYFSSMGEHSLPFHHSFAEWLKKNPDTKLAFQPGTYQIRFGTDALKDIYARTHMFFANREEAEEITRSEKGTSYEIVSQKLHALGPSIVILTDGPRGAFVSEGNRSFTISPYPDPKPPRERTGAGDAFSSTTVAACALGLPLEEALRWGAINSMSVVQEVGAQKGLLSQEKIRDYMRNAPEVLLQ